MKNFYLFFVFLFLLACGSNQNDSLQSKSIFCPPILFSSEHKNYFKFSNENVNIDNILYRAEINNASFLEKCLITNKFFVANFSVMLIVDPVNQNQDYIDLPLYLAILNENRELQDIQYFSVKNDFKKDLESNNFIQTEIIKNLKIKNKNITESSIIVVGYLLNKKQLKILN